jgi:hypothetical protein
MREATFSLSSNATCRVRQRVVMFVWHALIRKGGAMCDSVDRRCVGARGGRQFRKLLCILTCFVPGPTPDEAFTGNDSCPSSCRLVAAATMCKQAKNARVCISIARPDLSLFRKCILILYNLMHWKATSISVNVVATTISHGILSYSLPCGVGCLVHQGSRC